MASPNVPFPRIIRQGMTGEDVVAHKRALSRAAPDLYKWQSFTPLAGANFMDAVVAWKSSKGLGRERALGHRAHEKLERTRAKEKRKEWAFDARAIALAKAYHRKVTTTSEARVRAKIVQAGMFWYGHKWSIAYSQFRPFALGKPSWFPSRWDCSAFVTACHYAGGAPDPNGRGYDHQGYTGTLISRGRRVARIDQLKPGDLIFYGSSPGRPGFAPGAPTHVGLYVGKINGVHMSLQNGSYPMKYAAYNYRSDINHYRTYDVA